MDTPFVQQRCILDLQLQRSAAQRNPQWSHAQPSPLSTLNSWEHSNYPLPLIVRGELRLMSYSKHMWPQKISYRNDPVQVFPWNNTHHHTITFASLLHPSASIQHWHLTLILAAAIVLIYMHIACDSIPNRTRSSMRANSNIPFIRNQCKCNIKLYCITLLY